MPHLFKWNYSDCESVAVHGSFTNPPWTVAVPLARQPEENGGFSAILLLPPGTYQFKLVIDSSQWRVLSYYSVFANEDGSINNTVTLLDGDAIAVDLDAE